MAGEQTGDSEDSEPEDAEDSTELEGLEGLGVDERWGHEGGLRSQGGRNKSSEVLDKSQPG